MLTKSLRGDLNILKASNGQQAVETVSNHWGKISLILMDINMPIMDGFEATKTIMQMCKD